MAVGGQDGADVTVEGGPEQTRTAAIDAVATVMAAALVEAGAARYELSWPEVTRLVDADGSVIDLPAVVTAAASGDIDDAASGQRDTLATYLAARGVDLDREPNPQAGAPRLYGFITQMKLEATEAAEGAVDVMVWTNGLLLVPTRRSALATALVKDFGVGDRVEALATRPFCALVEEPGARHLALADIEAATVPDVGRLRIDIKLRDGQLVGLRSTMESFELDDIRLALRQLMGDRVGDEAWSATGGVRPRPGIVSWFVHDTVARVGLVAGLIALFFGAFWYSNVEFNTVMSRTEQLITVPASVTAIDENWFTVRFDDPPAGLPETVEYDDTYFGDPTNLAVGSEVTMLVHPSDPEYYALEQGMTVDRSDETLRAVGTGVTLAGTVGAFAWSLQRRRRSYS